MNDSGEKTFYLATHGCKLNQSESQAIREAWLKAGWRESERPEEAARVILNSCAVTSQAERDARNAIYRFRRLAPAAKIILTGCATRLIENFKPRKNCAFARPDVFVRDKISLMSPPGAEPAQERILFPGVAGYKRGRPVVRVQDGCSRMCSYCVVPFARGKPTSRPPREILAECRRLLDAGFAELILSGVNLDLYSSPDGDFWRLLAWLDKELAPEYAGRARFRVSSIEPGGLTDDAIAVLGDCGLVCPHLHLSLQHASASVLRAMRRERYSLDSTLEGIAKLRRVWPIMGLGADLIAGFPGETDADLRQTLDAIPALGLTYAHVFPYSRRPGTVAASLPRQLPAYEKRSRAKLVREAAEKQKRKFMESLLGGVTPVAADAGEDAGRGVNPYYVQCRLEPGKSFSGAGLVNARAVALDQNGLIVVPTGDNG